MAENILQKNITYSKRPEEHDAKNNKKQIFGENRTLMAYIQSRQIKRKQNEFVLPVHYCGFFFNCKEIKLKNHCSKVNVNCNTIPVK